MKRNEVIQVRVDPALKARVKEKGDMSAYVRGLIEADLGLSNGTVDLEGSQAKAERVAGSTGGSVPVAEPRIDSDGTAATTDLADIAASLRFDKLVKQFEAQPNVSPEQAQERARKQLGL